MRSSLRWYLICVLVYTACAPYALASVSASASAQKRRQATGTGDSALPAALQGPLDRPGLRRHRDSSEGTGSRQRRLTAQAPAVQSYAAITRVLQARAGSMESLSAKSQSIAEISRVRAGEAPPPPGEHDPRSDLVILPVP